MSGLSSGSFTSKSPFSTSHTVGFCLTLPPLSRPASPSLPQAFEPLRAQLLGFVHLHASVLRLPGIDCVFGNPALPRHLHRRSACFDLLQRINDLLRVQLAFRHPTSHFIRPKSYFLSGE
jgi:hypothetical protein